MAGKTPKTPQTPSRVKQDRRRDLEQLSGFANRSEADRARTILLSLGGRTSAEIGAAFGRRKLCEQKFRRVREDTVRDWRKAFPRGGEAQHRHPAPGSPLITGAIVAILAGVCRSVSSANW